jgi:glutaryl-CoA dehydrogenase
MPNIFSSLKNAYQLFKHIDFNQLDALSKKVDLPKMVETISALDDKQLSGMMKMMDGNTKKKELPPIEGDFYHLGDEALKDEDRALQLKVRAF